METGGALKKARAEDPVLQTLRRKLCAANPAPQTPRFAASRILTHAGTGRAKLSERLRLHCVRIW
jgi:hypothetical protein